MAVEYQLENRCAAVHICLRAGAYVREDFTLGLCPTLAPACRGASDYSSKITDLASSGQCRQLGADMCVRAHRFASADGDNDEGADRSPFIQW
ncbi:unnamed protein product [Schistocephalus solidus]|uniref:Uncharacterized protein n=1 Tax=Schistocephalus solidus TaxID=70667 RepID=A0A183TTR1_SCHSO|nr:unnamed protein product [Schistocephalus solidus]